MVLVKFASAVKKGDTCKVKSEQILAAIKSGDQNQTESEGLPLTRFNVLCAGVSGTGAMSSFSPNRRLAVSL